MDCETARLFLHFDRPGERDLGGPEADELHAHLEHCSGCNTLAQSASRLDQHLGRAMRAVEVPAGLKSRLLERLAADRRVARRRRIGRFARWASVAACLALLLWAGFAWTHPTKKDVSPYEVVSSLNISRPDLDKVNRGLKDLDRLFAAPSFVSDTLGGGGEGPGAPDFVNYRYQVGGPSFSELPGYAGYKYPKVPQLVFAHGSSRAIIYVLDNRRFRVGELEGANDYEYKLDVVEPGNGFTYLILHNGPNPGAWRSWLFEVKPDDE
jgi:hypothetical protein